MFLAGTIGRIGAAFALLTIAMLPQDFSRNPAGPVSRKAGVAAFIVKNEIMKMQDTLRLSGHYRGEVDGVFGLRTRASLRAYQKAENLTVTGQVDTRTADRLGVRPELAWGNSNHAERDFGQDRGGAAGELNMDKPSAGIPRRASRLSKTSRKKISSAAIEDNRREEARKQQAVYETPTQ